MKQLSGQDTLFLNAETHGLPMHLSCFSVYQGENINLDHLENTIMVRLNQELSLLRYKLYKVPYNLDFPYWVEDPEFDAVFHIQKIALPEPNNPDSLKQLLGRLHSQPLNAERPLWQIWIIDRLGESEEYPDNSVGLLFKIHHSLMHFGNGEQIFQALHGMADTRTTLQREQKRSLAEEGEVLHGEKSVSKLEVFSRAVLNNSKQSLQLLQLAGSAISHLRNSSASPSTPQISRTVFNQRISASRVIERVKLPIGDLHQQGVDIDALTLDVIGKALDKYLKEQEHSPDYQLVAGLPILEDDQFGQRALFSRIPLDNQQADLQLRQKKIREELDTLKDNIELPRLANSLINNLYAPLIAWGVKSVIGSGLTSVLPPLCHCIISQIPGYFDGYQLDNLRMIDACGFGPLMPNVGLFHAVSCDSQHLDITITACAEHMRNPGFYHQCLVDVLDELKLELVNKEKQIDAVITPRPRRKRKAAGSGATTKKAEKLASQNHSRQ